MKPLVRDACRTAIFSPLSVAGTAISLGLLCAPVYPAEIIPPGAFVSRQRVTCPVCRHSFEAFAPGAEKADAGIDRDLFARSNGPQTVFYLVSTCPSCLYSGYLVDFATGRALSPSLTRKIKDRPRLPRPAGLTKDTDQQLIDPLDRYNLAITCYEWGQRSDESLAWLHLRASWVARDGACVLPPTPRMDRTFRYARRWFPQNPADANIADLDLHAVTLAAANLGEGRFNRFQEAYIRVYVAYLLRRHGENTQAEPLLREAANDLLLEEKLRLAAGRMAASIAAEQSHQAKAVIHLERAFLAEQVAPANRGVAAYLTAELCRRLGRTRDAARWLHRAQAAGETLPDNIRMWLRERPATAPAAAIP